MFKKRSWAKLLFIFNDLIKNWKSKKDKENYLEKLDELIEKGSTVEFRFVK